jgi:hypothetical protein
MVTRGVFGKIFVKVVKYLRFMAGCGLRRPNIEKYRI